MRQMSLLGEAEEQAKARATFAVKAVAEVSKVARPKRVVKRQTRTIDAEGLIRRAGGRLKFTEMMQPTERQKQAFRTTRTHRFTLYGGRALERG